MVRELRRDIYNVIEQLDKESTLVFDLDEPLEDNIHRIHRVVMDMGEKLDRDTDELQRLKDQLEDVEMDLEDLQERYDALVAKNTPTPD